MEKKKPYAFTATAKPFTVQIEMPSAISGYTVGNRHASFYKHIPLKKGDTFRLAKDGVLLNGVLVERAARPPKEIVWKVSWVANRLRVAVFQDRDRIWSRRLKKFTKKFDKPYWTACDLRSYHIGCADTITEAVKNLIRQAQATNLCAEEEKAKGHSVIRWRCLLEPKEMKEMETKAKKTGFILDAVEVPPFPKAWEAGLKKLRKAKRKQEA